MQEFKMYDLVYVTKGISKGKILKILSIGYYLFCVENNGTERNINRYAAIILKRGKDE